MPLFDYLCREGHLEEHLFMGGEDAPEFVPCRSCIKHGPKGNWAKKQVPLISRTAHRWGDTNGHYSHNLGAYVNNSQERDRILKEKKLVDLRDLDQHYFEDRLEQECQEHIEHKKTMDEYKENLATCATKEDAIAKTFSVSKLQEKGLLDSGIRGE